MPLNLQVIESSCQWQKAMDALPEFPGKVYYSYEYLSAYEQNGDGRVMAVTMHDDAGSIAFYPFIIKPIPDKLGHPNLYDIETVYGYGGPFFHRPDGLFVKHFCRQFSDWALQNGVVAEFIRFNPLAGINADLADFYQTSLNRKTVVIRLNPDFNAVLNQCSAARKRNYRRALTANLAFTPSDDLSDFKSLYHKTMLRLKAERYYFFSDAYFSALEKMPRDKKLFAKITASTGETVAAGIFLADGPSLHYHLGAADDSFKNFQCSAFMILEAARHAAFSGQQLLHLGGGLTLASDDPLFRFKKGFSSHFLDFFIGKRIHQPEKYNDLSSRWRSLTGLEPSILLHYHYGIK